jgi:hypothetical protein
MSYTAKTAKELREQAGSLLSKIATELGLIQTELESILAGTGFASGSESVEDGGTIAHGLGDTPTVVIVTGSFAGEIVTATADATNITVSIKTTLGEAGTTQTVSWMAKL